MQLVYSADKTRHRRHPNPISAKGCDRIRNGARYVFYRHDNAGDDFVFLPPLDVQGKSDVAIQNFDVANVAGVSIQDRTRLDHYDLAHHAPPRLRSGYEWFHKIHGFQNNKKICSFRAAKSQSNPILSDGPIKQSGQSRPDDHSNSVARLDIDGRERKTLIHSVHASRREHAHGPSSSRTVRHFPRSFLKEDGRGIFPSPSSPVSESRYASLRATIRPSLSMHGDDLQ